MLLGKEASISIPQRGGPTPPPALPGDDSEAADQDGGSSGPDRPHSRASAACGTRKACCQAEAPLKLERPCGNFGAHSHAYSSILHIFLPLTWMCNAMQVLVVFHLLNSSAWFSPAHLLPFSQRKHEKATAGREAIGSSRTSRLAIFERAIKVASHRRILLEPSQALSYQHACLHTVAGAEACQGSGWLNRAL